MAFGLKAKSLLIVLPLVVVSLFMLALATENYWTLQSRLDDFQRDTRQAVLGSTFRLSLTHQMKEVIDIALAGKDDAHFVHAGRICRESLIEWMNLVEGEEDDQGVVERDELREINHLYTTLVSRMYEIIAQGRRGIRGQALPLVQEKLALLVNDPLLRKVSRRVQWEFAELVGSHHHLIGILDQTPLSKAESGVVLTDLQYHLREVGAAGRFGNDIFRQMAAYSSRVLMDAEAADLERRQEDARQALHEWKLCTQSLDSGHHDGDLSVIEKIEEQYDRLNAIGDEVLDLVVQGRRDDAWRWFDGHLEAQADEILIPEIMSVMTEEEEEIDEAMTQIEGLATRAMSTFFVVAGFILLLGMGTPWLLARKIVQPIIELTQASKNIGTGALPAQVNIHSTDEVGQLAATFNEMTHRLHEAREELEQRVRDRTTELSTEITARRETEQELRKLSVSVEQSPASVVITDIHGTIEYVNPRFTRVTGYTRQESLGQNPRILKSGKWPKKAYEGLWKMILSGKTWRGEFENKKKNGELYWESASISPIRDAEGVITHFLAVKEDITERKKREQELREINTELIEGMQREKIAAEELSQTMENLESAKIAAEAADRTKSEFLANMSHEIRTPMTAILGFAETIADNVTRPENVEAVATIRRNGEYLLGIINDILDLSKIEAEKMTVENIACQPVQIIAEVAALMRGRGEEKGLTFNIEFIGAIPETIFSDPTRLRQILINLVGNAIKFTEEGGIRLMVRVANDDEKNFLQFDVLDTGLGMNEEQAAGLFLPFTQADSSTTRKFGGTGLGLTISKRLAQLLGGDIVVAESQVGVGTRFRATVDIGPLEGVKMLEDPQSALVVTPGTGPAPGTGPNRGSGQGSSDITGCRILLAEDGPDNQRLISFILKKAGATVIIMENGLLALEAALAAREVGEPFAVILMDMQMPVMGGYEATAKLRAAGYERPIIALTAHAMDGDRKKCLDAGCDDYATKPINRAKLIEMIARWSDAARV